MQRVGLPAVTPSIQTRKVINIVSSYTSHPHRINSRVSDPHWFNADPDPDPAFVLIADPDSGSGFRIRIPDLDPGFDDLKLKKIYN
jgi:hypothetical protein